MSENYSSQKLVRILSAQIVHDIKNLPRGKVSPEAILMLEAAYKVSTGLEDLIIKASSLLLDEERGPKVK